MRTILVKIFNRILLVIVIIITSSCGNETKQVNAPKVIEVPNIELNLKIARFEKDLFEYQEIDSNAVITLRKKYGDFFDLWCIRLSGVIPGFNGKPDNVFIAQNLNQYLHDKYIKEVYLETEKKFEDIDWIKNQITDVFKRYHLLFPKKIVPELVTYIAPFNSNITTLDSVLGLGLHFYLGSDYKYYSSLALPQYMTKKFRKEYIISDLVKGWLDSEYLNDTVQRSFINQMIYQGKTIYALEVLNPDDDDTIKIGYTAAQLDWSYKNEGKIWGFFIEQQLLYSNNAKTYMKFISDGNTTGGFPKESPSKMGVFIGWQIVRAYMKNNQQISLEELFNNQNAQDILAKSGYKPTKVKI